MSSPLRSIDVTGIAENVPTGSISYVWSPIIDHGAIKDELVGLHQLAPQGCVVNKLLPIKFAEEQTGAGHLLGAAIATMAKAAMEVSILRFVSQSLTVGYEELDRDQSELICRKHSSLFSRILLGFSLDLVRWQDVFGTLTVSMPGL
jgi:hypothetical protein